MKKLFTLLCAFALFGSFAAKADTWNLEFKGDGSNLYEKFTIETQEGSGPKQAVNGVTSDSFSVSSVTENTLTVYLTSSTYQVDNITYGDNQEMTPNGENGSWNFVLNPTMTGTVSINVSPAGTDNSNNTTIPITYEPNDDDVLSVSFNKGNLENKGSLVIPEEYRGDDASITITLAPGTTYTDATATYTYDTNQTAPLACSFVPASGDANATVNISNIPLKVTDVYQNVAEAITVTFIEASDEDQLTTKISITAVGLASDESPYDYIESVTVNDEPFTLPKPEELSDGSYSPTYVFSVNYQSSDMAQDAEQVEVKITLADGYVFRQMDGSGIEMGGVSAGFDDDGNMLDNVVIVYINAVEANDGKTAYFEIAAPYADNVPVSFEAGEITLIEIIESVSWDGLTTFNSWDGALEGYEVGFPTFGGKNNLVINIKKNEENVPYYIVSEASVSIEIAGNTDVTNGDVTDDYTQVVVEIPANAEKVTITLTATENDAAGVAALNAVSGDAVIYNLQGQKVANPSKGIFIVNGKKVVIR